MKVEVEGQEIIVRSINYAGKLGLQGEFADVYKNGTEGVKQKEFNLLLGHTAEIAFLNPDESLKQYEYEFQLKILTACMMQYLGLSDKEKKDDGG
jgi:hypothetical protein